MEKINYNDTLNITPLELANLFGISVQALHKYTKEIKINTLVATRKHRILPSQVRKIAESRGIKFQNQVIHLHNSKGGVGKTTISHATALKAATIGMKTLAIDLDPQANLTKSFGQYLRSEQRPTFKSLVFGTFKDRKISMEETVIGLHDYLDLIPSDMSLANFDLELTLKSAGSGVNPVFQPIFQKLRQVYDLIVIDSPPAISSVTLGATFNSDKLVIPSEPDDFSIDGVDQVFQQLAKANETGMKVTPMVFVNKINQGRSHDLQKVSTISQTYGDYLLGSLLPWTVKFKEQIEAHKNIWDFGTIKKPDVVDYLNSLVIEILGLEEWKHSYKKSSLNGELNA